MDSRSAVALLPRLGDAVAGCGAEVVVRNVQNILREKEMKNTKDHLGNSPHRSQQLPAAAAAELISRISDNKCDDDIAVKEEWDWVSRPRMPRRQRCQNKTASGDCARQVAQAPSRDCAQQRLHRLSGALLPELCGGVGGGALAKGAAGRAEAASWWW